MQKTQQLIHRTKHLDTLMQFHALARVAFKILTVSKVKISNKRGTRSILEFSLKHFDEFHLH